MRQTPSMIVVLPRAMRITFLLLLQQFYGAAFQREPHLHLRGVQYHSSNLGRSSCVPSLVQINTRTCPVAISMLPTLPPSYEYDDSVSFFQRATGTRIRGRKELERSVQRWEKDFREAVDDELVRTILNDGGGNGMKLQLQPRLDTVSATTTSPTTLLVRWNLTYVDPSVQWMVSLAESVPGWTVDLSTYTDKVEEERRFSYSAVGRLFARAIFTGCFRVPMACIEGVSTCEFVQTESGDTSSKRRKIRSIVEDLAYAQDLNRGVMANRLCARDLQFFLETVRKPPEYYNELNSAEAKRSGGSGTNGVKQDDEYWEDRLASLLPWRSVPGMMDPLYIEAQAEEDIAVNLPVLFGVFSIAVVVLFASWIAPNLIGQSLFGQPSYIVPPSELNEIIAF
ncbi:unnamed protein product [Pseudo-nitzschia multistriata]|uniref:Transmembrane protein n=1 Tax=Pseudo-nitzschia multistriata TaxID=183589 RepID=A0A448YV29_9STRA|nr:unnamed protein product [Pseudo-nitzschia multistriata]